MTRIEDLQARLTAALERIGGAVEGWEAPDAVPEPIPQEPEEAPNPSAEPADLARLREALEDEKLANAQLEERVRSLHAKATAARDAAALREQLEAQRESLAQLDGDLQRLRRANDSLRDICEALREANSRGVGEPHLINKAMLAELESLRASRAADAAETRAVMDALTPLLHDAAANQEETA